MIYKLRHNDYLKDLMQFLDDNIVLVEVGVYSGESAEIFLESGKLEKYIGVDPFLANYDNVSEAAKHSNFQEVEDKFRSRILEKYDAAVLYKRRFEDVYDVLKADVVYIDASHDYESVKRHIEMAKHVASGVIAGHDYTTYEGVRRAVDEIFGKPDAVFRDSSWLVDFKERED